MSRGRFYRECGTFILFSNCDVSECVDWERFLVKVIEIDRECNDHIELPAWCNCKCVAIYFDGGEVEPLYVSEEVFFKYGLYDCEEICKDEYENYDFLFRVECAKHSATSFLFGKKYTSYEVAKKLYKLEHREDVVDEVVRYYQKLEYINDEKYLKAYIDGVIKNKIMSLKVLCSKLTEKGFDKEDIVTVALNRGFDEFDMAQKALTKKCSGEIPSEYKEKMKVMRYLSGKGFAGETISDLFNTP